MNCSYERISGATETAVSERSSLLGASTTNNYQSVSIASRAVICILFTELCIELTFLGIVGNLQLFATDENQLNFSPQMASTITYIFQGTCCLLPVFGGWLADSVLGKFLVVFYSAIIYVVGTLLLVLGSISDNDEHIAEWAKTSLTTSKSFKRAFFLCGLALVAVAMGGIKSNLVPLGAEQVSKNKTGRYFFWFYWFINIGAILAYTFVVYVQQNVSYFYGYLIPTCSILIAIIIFLAGKPSYFIRPPAASVLTRTVKIVREAIKRSYYSQTTTGVHWLDRAKRSFGGSHERRDVEDVKKVYRLIPIFTTFILFWMVCGQDGTAMIYQGKYMDISLTSDFQIPIASLSVFVTISVLVWIPIMNKIVYPLLAKCYIHVSRLQRIGTGMAIITLSMVCAGGIEMLRVNQCCMQQMRPPDNNATTVSNITILYQVPQYASIGLVYVLTSLTGIELVYVEAPPSLRGVVIGVFLLTAGLGSYLGAGVVAVVNAISGAHSSAHKWYPDKDNINDGRLAYYFFLLAGLMFLNFILYIFVALRFKASKAASSWESGSSQMNSTSSERLLQGASDFDASIG